MRELEREREGERVSKGRGGGVNSLQTHCMLFKQPWRIDEVE